MKIFSSLPLVGLLVILTGCGSAPQRPAALIEGERLLGLGVKAYRNDDLLTAAGFFTKALAHHQGLDHAEGQLLSRINLTEVALAVGNLDSARNHLQQAELFAQAPLAHYQPRLLLLHSSLALAAGEFETARTLSEQLLPAKFGGSAKIDAGKSIVREALINRTRVAFATADASPSVWLERLERVADDDANALAQLERFRAELARRNVDLALATRHLQRALDLCKGIPSRRCIAGTLEEWGGQLLANGDLTGAEERYQRALAVRLALLDRGGSGKTLRQLADISHATGRGERATTLSGWADMVTSGSTIDWSRLRGDTLPR